MAESSERCVAKSSPRPQNYWRHDLELVTISLLLTFTFGGLNTNFLVILLEGGKIFTGLGELTFLHTLTDVPVHERALGVHQIELVVDAGEDLCDGRGVRDHADSAHDLGQIATRDDGGRLVVDTALEARGGPVDELDGACVRNGVVVIFEWSRSSWR